MSHTINDLRGHLFATLDGLRDKDAPMDIARAKAVADVAQTIINTAKVEVDAMRLAGNKASTGFLGLEAPAPEPAKPVQGKIVVRDDANGKTTVEQRGGMTITRHTAK